MRSLVLVLVLAACRHGVPPLGAGSTASIAAGTSTTVSDFDTAERARLEAGTAHARQTVSSPEFHAALAAIDSMHITADAQTMSGAEVDEVYAGQSSAMRAMPVMYEPASLWRRMTRRGETATTGQDDTTATTWLHPIVLERLAGSLEARACAINTLAHEWTHSIRDNGHMLFTDDGYKKVNAPIVSYTVGAVAQCVYLARARSALDLRACIVAAGTHSFEECTCAPGWVDAFVAGDTPCKRTD